MTSVCSIQSSNVTDTLLFWNLDSVLLHFPLNRPRISKNNIDE